MSLDLNNMYYYSLNQYLKNTFGCKVYKLALQSGAYCPNRDGTVGTGGCIFCSQSGSGEFAEAAAEDTFTQIENAKGRVKSKNKGGKYIAYFQNYSATYLPLERLEANLKAAMSHPDIVAVSLGTRPDCLGQKVLSVIERYNKIKPVFVELGLQTIHKKTAEYIRRGYTLDVFDVALKELKKIGVNVVVHMIIGLPGETADMITQTAQYIGKSGADGIKFHLLHILKGTDLYADYLKGEVSELSLEEYTEILAQCINSIPKNMVVHRLTGDGDKKILAAPLWSADKKRVLNYINAYFEKSNVEQGGNYCINMQ